MGDILSFETGARIYTAEEIDTMESYINMMGSITVMCECDEIVKFFSAGELNQLRSWFDKLHQKARPLLK